MIDVVSHSLKSIRNAVLDADISKHKGDITLLYSYQYGTKASIGKLTVRDLKAEMEDEVRQLIVSKIEYLVRDTFGNHSFNYHAKVILGRGTMKVIIELDTGYHYSVKVKEPRIIKR